MEKNYILKDKKDKKNITKIFSIFGILSKCLGTIIKI